MIPLWIKKAEKRLKTLELLASTAEPRGMIAVEIPSLSILKLLKIK